ncbi:MAG: hypothetical protein HOP00_12125, partial [Nitrospira sp.]|nr:hypothetical protein [Nitrospira sp.]
DIGQVLSLLADVIVQRFSGQCLVGNTIIPGGEWQNWKSFEQQRVDNSAMNAE